MVYPFRNSIKHINPHKIFTNHKCMEPLIKVFRKESSSKNLILFVHGFGGDSENTFGKIPAYVNEEPRLNGWDMVSIGYSSNAWFSIGIGIWAAIPDLSKLANFINTTIEHQYQDYERIAIIAHSMGGLVVQKAIVEMKEDSFNKIKFLLLFGTPSNGLRKAAFAYFWNRQLRDMANDGDFIVGLRKKWDDIFKNKYPFKFRVVAGTDDEFVPTGSSHKPFDEQYCKVVSGNHLAIVKPNDKNHAGYQLILSVLTNSVFTDQYTDKEAVNLLLGNYSAVVNDLLPRKDKLDKNGLAKLVFALEGLDRPDEAVSILENSDTAKNNSDLLGIIGGRYKRKYLNTYETDDAEKSFSYYTKGLQIALAKDDHPQIHYHAINLAFLSLVYKEDRKAMKTYAQTALDAVEKCQEDPWSLPTLAEANMYLDNMDVAKAKYMEAAAKAGVREKLSIYANAYRGYSTKNNTEEDEFIKILKEKLLA